MLRHVVMFRWDDAVGDAHVAAVAERLEALRQTVPGIREYRHGRDVVINEGNFDYAVVADFDDRAGYEAYRDHPAHRAFVADMIAGRVAERAAVQFDC